MIQDSLFFAAVIEGLQYRKREVEARIAEIRGELTAQQPVATRKGVGTERHMSAAGRAAIAAATRKRWAAWRKAKGARRAA